MIITINIVIKTFKFNKNNEKKNSIIYITKKTF